MQESGKLEVTQRVGGADVEISGDPRDVLICWLALTHGISTWLEIPVENLGRELIEHKTELLRAMEDHTLIDLTKLNNKGRGRKEGEAYG